MLERIFHLKENKTTVKTEVIAGVVTFITMAYVLFVHPHILVDAGMDFEGVLFATCISTAVSTLIMGLWANYPFALAPGMGLNAYFAYTAVPWISQRYGIQDAWKVALGAVFISGCVFIVLTFSRIRNLIIKAVPEAIKVGIAAGIGFFIAMMGLQKAGIVVRDDVTMVTLGNLHNPETVLALLGLVLMGALMVRRVPGAILLGILIITFAGVVLGMVELPKQIVKLPHIRETAFALDIRSALRLGFLNIIFVFLFIDLFDTMGTLVGIGERGGFMVKGELPRATRALFADSFGTVFGALLGTSTVTTYIESAAGISEGGRTGLTAVVVAILFICCVVLSPIAMMIPGFATAPALIVIGSLMMAVVGKISWEEPDEAIAAFVTMIAVPLTYSIANGLALGFILYPIIKAIGGKSRDVSIAVYVLAALFILRFALLRF